MRMDLTGRLAALAVIVAATGCQATTGTATPAAAATPACPPAAAPAPPPEPSAKLAPAEPGIPPHVHIEDVIYGRKYGTSLTLDVFQPVQPNGAAIVAVDTGGWVTDYDHIWAGGYAHFLKRGYTVFHVVHGSSPKFTVPEQVSDVRRAVKFIRFHAADYKIDPLRIGITGASTGGLLAVMMGVTDTAEPDAKDPVERMSSRVQAVACFAPQTDLTIVTWPWPYKGDPPIGAFAFFDFMEKPRSRVTLSSGNAPGQSPGVVHMLTEPDKGKEILKAISPMLLVTAAAAPTMIIQGDKDQVIPLERSQRFIAKLAEAGVPGKLVPVPGSGHGIPNVVERTAELADWFDVYLKPKGAAAPAAR
jgi:acetyl esterase/lipase